MRTYRVKPSKPQAVLVGLVGAGMLVAGLVTFPREGKNPGLILLWAAFLVVIVGYGLWSAFSKHGGSPIVLVKDDDATQPPARGGSDQR